MGILLCTVLTGGDHLFVQCPYELAGMSFLGGVDDSESDDAPAKKVACQISTILGESCEEQDKQMFVEESSNNSGFSSSEYSPLEASDPDQNSCEWFFSGVLALEYDFSTKSPLCIYRFKE